MRAAFFFLFSLLISLSLSPEAFSKDETTRNWNRGRGYQPFLHATEEGILLENASDTLLYDFIRLDSVGLPLRLSFRSHNFHSDPHKTYFYYNGDGEPRGVKFPKWGFFITSDKETLVVSIESKEKEGILESHPAIELKINYLKSGVSKNLTIKDKINPYHKDNLWEIEIAKERTCLRAGEKSMSEIFKNLPSLNDLTGFGFFAGWGGKIVFSDIKASYSFSENTVEYPDVRQWESYFKKSKNPMEGFWTAFDRNLEESLLKFGGNYVLACFENGEGYDFLYVEGAVVNKENWKKGDLKIRLLPTPFKGIYNVVWYDSMKKPMEFEIKAEEGEGHTLTFQFPYQASTFRFRKPDP